MKNRDIVISRVIFFIALVVVITWIWNGLIWLWNWYTVASETGTVWFEIWSFVKQNVSILVVVYGIICLQVSGVSELKFEKNFLKAFILAIFLTPPVMMVIYGHRKNSGQGSLEVR